RAQKCSRSLRLSQHPAVLQDAPELIPDDFRARDRLAALPAPLRRAQALECLVAHSSIADGAGGLLGSLHRGRLFRLLTIECQVAQFVGSLILLPAHVNERHRLEIAHQTLRFLREELQVVVLDAVLAVHLLHEQLAVAVDAQARQAEGLGLLERLDEGGVLGDVVGLLAEGAVLLDRRPAGGVDDDGVRGLARIAAGGAVDVDDGRVVAHAWLQIMDLASRDCGLAARITVGHDSDPFRTGSESRPGAIVYAGVPRRKIVWDLIPTLPGQDRNPAPHPPAPRGPPLQLNDPLG